MGVREACHNAGRAPANTAGTICTAWIDYASFFMSVVKTCQIETERFCGVHPGVTEVVELLHTDVKGCYETAYGLTPWYDIRIGTGQGCVNGATRAKLALVLSQRVVSKLCVGYGFTLNPDQRICQLYYADDVLLQAPSMHELRKMIECCWIVAKISGLRMTIKQKRKTAWAGTYWTRDSRGHWIERDINCGAFKMVLPDGTPIPQVRMDETYKYLGSELTPGYTGSQDRIRAKVVTRSIGVIGVLGSIKNIGIDTLNKAINMTVGGLVDYYGRTCILRWQDME